MAIASTKLDLCVDPVSPFPALAPPHLALSHPLPPSLSFGLAVWAGLGGYSSVRRKALALILHTILRGDKSIFLTAIRQFNWQRAHRIGL